MATAFSVLVRVSGAELEDVLVIERFPFTIGREASSSLVLRDARVKRNHAVIERSGDHTLISDLQSTHHI